MPQSTYCDPTGIFTPETWSHFSAECDISADRTKTKAPIVTAIHLLRQGFGLLTAQRRREAGRITIALVFSAIAETLAMASVFPFLTLLVNPSLAEQSAVVDRLLAMVGLTSATQGLIFLGVVAAVLFLMSACLRALVEIRVHKFAQFQRHELAQRVLTRVVARPYSYFLGRHSGELTKTVLGDVDRVVRFVLQPSMFLLAQLTRFIAVFLLVLIVAPGMTVVATVVLAVSYVTAFRVFRSRTKHSGALLSAADSARFRVVSELLRNIKALRVAGRERQFVSEFGKSSEVVARQYAINQILIRMPRLVIETLAIGGVILLAVGFVVVNGGLSQQILGETLPKLGLLSLAGLRMLPAVQEIFHSAWSIQLGAASVAALREELDVPMQQPRSAATPVPLRASMSAKGLSFRYQGAREWAFRDVSFHLDAGESLAIVGPTGAGKSTLLDVILGLQPPSEGEFRVDGRILDADEIPGWQATIGYVPQKCDLLDGTIEQNIKYGDPSEVTDRERLSAAIRDAQLVEMLERQPHGLDTHVGEAGVRLSGGEQQRISIARAIYRDASVVVLDEPTSALDRGTEDKLIDVIAALSHSRTVVVVTHQDQLADCCDHILRLPT